MRKIFFIVISIVLVSQMSTSCKKDKNDDVLDSEKCDELADTYYQAVVDYSTNPSTQTCEAFVQATENYINGCAILTPQQRQEFQQAVDEADCSQ